MAKSKITKEMVSRAIEEMTAQGLSVNAASVLKFIGVGGSNTTVQFYLNEINLEREIKSNRSVAMPEWLLQVAINDATNTAGTMWSEFDRLSIQKIKQVEEERDKKIEESKIEIKDTWELVHDANQRLAVAESAKKVAESRAKNFELELAEIKGREKQMSANHATQLEEIKRKLSSQRQKNEEQNKKIAELSTQLEIEINRAKWLGDELNRERDESATLKCVVASAALGVDEEATNPTTGN